MMGICFSIICCTIGAVSGMPGLLMISSAERIFSAVCWLSSHSMLCSSSICLYLSLMADMSDTNTSNPFCFASTAAPAPLSPAPNIAILFMSYFFSFFIVNVFISSSEIFKLSLNRYLIFSVMMVIAARMMVVIQKRMVIFDSWNG